MANTLNLGNGDWATKENSLLGYNSENGNYKPLPFDFTRASNGTFVNKSGLIETAANGVPRIDFSDSEDGALLLEPQRTNRMPNSEDGSTWTLSNITLSSLSGGLNKEYYQITSLGNTGRFDVVSNNWVNLTAGTYTASVFAKKGTSDQIILTTRANYSSQSAYSVFNLTSGTVVSNNGVTGSIEPYSDGWYRCAITFTNSGSYTDFASFAFGFNFNSSSTDTLFVASPQSEIGSYATSYIKTEGSAVTRVADGCSQTPPNGIINSSEGVLYADFEISDLNTFLSYPISIYGIGATIQIYYRSATQSISFLSSVGGIQYLYHSNINPLGRHKVALVYKNNQYSSFADGVLLDRQNSGNVPSPNTLNVLGLKDSGSSYFRGKVKDVKLYNTALTDQELIALTTI
jgi:hypothetical protein